MTRLLAGRWIVALALLALGLGTAPARADVSVADVAEEVNKKMVKLFGSGGFRGLASYGSGFIVSPDGYILTVASPLLDTRDLRVHLWDGRRYHAKVIVQEPNLDVALVKIDSKEKLNLPYFDVPAESKSPVVDAGTGILAFSNQFQIATRSEPVSVQQGRIAAYSRLEARRGVHDAPYKGNVYVIDAITNNVGAAGGVITTRKGKLLGIIGKELRNELTNTWINYAIPIQATITVTEENSKQRTVTILEVLEKKEKYAAPKIVKARKEQNHHGIILVPDVVELTPPYVEEVEPNSPAAKAGFRPDDLIVYVDGEQVNSIKAFNEIVGRIRPKAEVKIEVRRGDKLETLTMIMGEPLVKKTSK